MDNRNTNHMNIRLAVMVKGMDRTSFLLETMEVS